MSDEYFYRYLIQYLFGDESNNFSDYRWFFLGNGILVQAPFAMGFTGIHVTGILMRDF